MNMAIDTTIQYNGPQADVATLTGSPFWGFGVDGVLGHFVDAGWAVQLQERLPTPYGLSPLVVHMTNAAGRSILWIPSYGEIVNEDSLYHRNFEKVFWLLWQAGVKMLIVGGTSGIADWRSGEEAVQPGDVVLPWSFRTRPVHRGLPGTEYESMWSKCHFLLGDPFCPTLAQKMVKTLQPYVDEGQIRRVRTPADTRVALVVPDSITFETEYDILQNLAISKIASELQPERPPVATLHGDCLNPLLARYLGIHVLYYHMVSNYAQGLLPGEETAKDLHHLYTQVFPKIAIAAELELLANCPVPAGDSCKCTTSLTPAPPIFRQTLTQPTETGL